MKTLIVTAAIACVAFFHAAAQEKNSSKNPNYNQEMARRLGADDLGMKTYVIAFLKSGPVKMKDSVKRAELQKAHLKNIAKMTEAGKLVTAGPFLDNQQPLRGIYIFDVSSVDEARKLTESDPAVKAGTLIMELHPWYGSAAMTELPSLHKQIQKKGFGD